jgi:hypothetical protein
VVAGKNEDAIMLYRTILSVAGVIALAACAAPGQRQTTVSSYDTGYGSRVQERTDTVTPPTPAWARPGYDHSNWDPRSP